MVKHDTKSEKAIIFGAGSRGIISLEEIRKSYDVIFFVDNDQTLWGGYIDDIPIKSPDCIAEAECDAIIFCNYNASATLEWLSQVKEMGIGLNKVVFDYCIYIQDARVEFIKKFAKINVLREGCIAEAGVWKGDFAKELNQVFKSRKLYLFDTFEGFVEKDITEAFEEFMTTESDSKSELGLRKTFYEKKKFSDTSAEYVLSRMENKNNVVIKKGWFPESANGITDHFLFVNLDMDLYKPILAGLEFFAPLMVEQGVILVHDYFNGHCDGVKAAVDEWLNKNTRYRAVPIGGDVSILIVGF